MQELGICAQYLKPINDGLWSKEGTVIQEVTPRSYQVETDSEVMLRRNRRDLRLNNTNHPLHADLDTATDECAS